MEQYISKSALVAEITHKIKVLEAFVKNFDGISDKVEKAKNKIEALGDALLFIENLEVKEDLEKKEDVNSIIERIDNEIDRLLFNNGREIDYEDVIQMIRCKIRTIRNEIKAQKVE